MFKGQRTVKRHHKGIPKMMPHGPGGSWERKMHRDVKSNMQMLKYKEGHSKYHKEKHSDTNV